jgi:Domain of unknown function (DUF397)
VRPALSPLVGAPPRRTLLWAVRTLSLGVRRQGVGLMPDNDTVQWRTSSYCDTSLCVEVTVADGAVLVRQSGDPDGPRLSFSPAEWRAFIRGAADGEFDLV